MATYIRQIWCGFIECVCKKCGWLVFWGGVKNPAWVSLLDFLRAPCRSGATRGHHHVATAKQGRVFTLRVLRVARRTSISGPRCGSESPTRTAGVRGDRPRTAIMVNTGTAKSDRTAAAGGALAAAPPAPARGPARRPARAAEQAEKTSGGPTATAIAAAATIVTMATTRPRPLPPRAKGSGSRKWRKRKRRRRRRRRGPARRRRPLAEAIPPPHPHPRPRPCPRSDRR